MILILNVQIYTLPFSIIPGPLTDTYYSPIPWASSTPQNAYRNRLYFGPSCHPFTSLYIRWVLESHLPCLLCWLSLSVDRGAPGRALLQLCTGCISVAEGHLIMASCVCAKVCYVFHLLRSNCLVLSISFLTEMQ